MLWIEDQGGVRIRSYCIYRAQRDTRAAIQSLDYSFSLSLCAWEREAEWKLSFFSMFCVKHLHSHGSQASVNTLSKVNLLYWHASHVMMGFQFDAVCCFFSSRLSLCGLCARRLIRLAVNISITQKSLLHVPPIITRNDTSANKCRVKWTSVQQMLEKYSFSFMFVLMNSVNNYSNTQTLQRSQCVSVSKQHTPHK